MPVNRSFAPDLRKKSICEFLWSYGAFYDEVAANRAERSAQGFKPVGPVRDLPGLVQEIYLPTFQRHFVDLSTRRGKLIRTVTIEDFGFVKVRLTALAVLGVRTQMTSAQERDIIDVFSTTVLDLAHVDDAETALIRSGIAIQDYQVDIVLKLEVQDRKTLTTNVDTFVTTMKSQRDQGGRQAFDVTVLEKVENGCTPVTPPLPTDVVIEAGDPGKPGTAIRDQIRKEHPACEEIVTTEVDIGIAFKLPETKTEWTLDEIWICGVKTGETHIPHIYWRQRDAVLYGIVASPESVARVAAQVFRNCMGQAALATGILALVTSFASIGSAVLVFTAYVQQCLEINLGDVANIDCLLPDLKLVVAENVPWQPAF